MSARAWRRRVADWRKFASFAEPVPGALASPRCAIGHMSRVPLAQNCSPLGYTRTPKPFRSTLGTTITLTNADVPPFSLRVCRRDHSTVGERHSHVVDHEMCVRACGGGGDHWCPPSPRSAVVVFWTTPLITQTARSVVLLVHMCHSIIAVTAVPTQRSRL